MRREFSRRWTQINADKRRKDVHGLVGHASSVTDSVGKDSHVTNVTYTQAAIGFAKKNNIDPASLEVREEGNNKYVFAVVKQKGRPTPEVLAEALPKLVESIKFEKSMRWNDSGVAFSRPIRWYVALLGDIRRLTL